MVIFTRNKNANYTLVGVLLLLLVVVISGILISSWYLEFKTEIETDSLVNDRHNILLLKGLSTNGSMAILALRNTGEYSHTIKKVFFNNLDCNLTSSNIINSLSILSINCSLVIEDIYEVKVISDKGIYSKSFTVYE